MAKREAKKAPKRRFSKTFGILIYLVFLTTCAAVGTAARWMGDIVSSLSAPGEGLMQVWQGISNPRALFPGKDKLTLLLVGQDYNRDRRGIAYTANSRADTIMLLSVDLANRKLSACSVPRDTFVRAPDRVSGKINATFARGGVELLQETLQNEFDISIDHHIVIKPHAVREIVDSVGGVTVEAIDDMHYDDNWGGLHVHIDKGIHHLDGEQAEGYVRFREVNRYRMDNRGRMIPLRNVKSSLEAGDIRRTARQQELVSALVRQANRPGNLMRADKIITTGFEQVSTNLSRTQCLALATIFRGASGHEMASATIPGDTATRYGASYFIMDEERSKATIDWLINGDEAAMRRLIRISIKNGTETSGLAKLNAKTVSDLGYTAFSSGNAPKAAQTIIEFRRAAYQSAADEVARAIGGGRVQKAQSPGNEWDPEISVVVGEDLVPAKTAPVAKP